MRSSLWLLLVLACGDPARDDAPGDRDNRLAEIYTPPPESRRDRREREGRDRHAVDLYVDGIVVATIGEDQFDDWPRIDLQLPPDATFDRWRKVTLETDGDPVTLDRGKLAGVAPVLFPGSGRAASFGLFDPRGLEHKRDPRTRVDGVFEIRIELVPPAPESGSDRARSLARACTEVKRGEEKPPPGKGRWLGTAYQHNIDEYWTIDMTIDLSGSKVGDKVGSVIYHGHKCRGNLYRLPDVNGRPRVVERFWHNENGICVEACILELQCDGTALDYRGLYPDGSYVAHAKLLRAK